MPISKLEEFYANLAKEKAEKEAKLAEIEAEAEFKAEARMEIEAERRIKNG